MRRTVMLALLPLLAAGCASQPPAPPGSADQVAVHESVASAPPNFRIIKRLWIDYSRKGGYSHDEHVEIAKALESMGKLPSSFMLFPPISRTTGLSLALRSMWLYANNA